MNSCGFYYKILKIRFIGFWHVVWEGGGELCPQKDSGNFLMAAELFNIITYSARAPASNIPRDQNYVVDISKLGDMRL